MRQRLFHFGTHPIALMILSIILWMLYPPVVNYLVDQSNVFYIAAVAHSLAALFTLLYVGILVTKDRRLNLPLLVRCLKNSKILYPTLLSGLLICANHLLLYAALSTSHDFDVIAILIFETWPILFFYIDSSLRRKKGQVHVSDYIFSGAAFAGFLVLTAPNIDIADWILFDSPMLKTIGLATLGGLAMAINCYFRMKCMDGWSELSAKQNRPLNNFKYSLLTEAGVRTIAAPLLILAFFLSGATVPETNVTNFVMLAFVGVFILSLGSLLYDLSVFSAQNAAISALWYLMPVGAVVILAVTQGRLLNQYESVAAVLIVSSNIFLGLRYPLRSSLLILFVAVCAIGLWVLLAPVASIGTYYDVLAVSSIFFVLLATFALERTSSMNRERELILGEFNENVIGTLEQIDTTADSPLAKDQTFFDAIRRYILLNLHSFLRAFKDNQQLLDNQKNIEQLKYQLLPRVKQDNGLRERLLGLFKVGDRLMTMESDRLPPEEFVILFLLGGASVFFSLAFRPDTLAAGLFSLVYCASVIYLLLIIFERDRYTRVRHDHILICQNLLTYMHGSSTLNATPPSQQQETLTQIETTLEQRAGALTRRGSTYWIFGIFAFLFAGFGYAFLYASIEMNRGAENSPFASAGKQNTAHINIALLDWPSAKIKGYILADIINRHTELTADTVSVSNAQAFQEMDQKDGHIDIHPDVWVENSNQLIRRYVQAFGTVKLAPRATQATQGLCYTDTGLEQHDATLSYADLLNDALPAQFDLTGDHRGDIWVGSQKWSSLAIEKKRLAAYGLDKKYTFHAFDPDVMRTLLAYNEQNRQPTLFFCYYPDALFVDKHIHRVSENTYEPGGWTSIVSDKRNKQKAAGGMAWPNTAIKLAYRTELSQRSSALNNLINNFAIDNAELVRLLARMEAGQKAETLADQWVQQHRAEVLEWLTGFKLVQERDASTAEPTEDEPTEE